MGQDREKETNKDDYYFIKETIKEKPLNKKKIICKIAAIVGSGVLFGCCAAAACVGTFPFFAEQFGMGLVPREDLKIVTPSPEAEMISAGKIEAQTTAGQAENEGISALANYEAIYEEALRISEEPRKALVTVNGISEDQDLLDDTQLSYSRSMGVIFLETDTEMYILTCGDPLEHFHDLEITFADGSTVVGQLCKEDNQTGLIVAKVSKEDIGTETIKKLSVVDLGKYTSLPKTAPVIAIGCPAGDRDAVVYGMMTSVSGRMQVADTEYNILATDMHGSPEGSGVLLDITGNVLGVIIGQEGNTTNSIRALPVSQIRSLIERLSNEKPIMYTGVYGTTITQAQSDRLNIPMGVYVDKVENNSPAMTAGIQSGDIICSMNGNRIRNMQSYNAQLQRIEPGEEAVITIARKRADGNYVKRDYRIKIEER